MSTYSLHSPDGSFRERPFVVSYFLVPGYSMLALSSAIEPLRSANRVLGEERFRWNVIGTRIGPVGASNGLEIRADYGLDDIPSTDLTIIVASLGLENHSDKKLLQHIRWLRRQDQMIGAISNGTMILAQAGALDGRKVTIHWEMHDRLMASFPDLDVSTDLFRIDRNTFTAGGGAASMDMMLELISRREGRAVAADVAEQFLHGVIRPPTDGQKSDPKWRYRLTDRRLEKAITIMEKQIDPPVRISDMAQEIGISERQLERLFLKALGRTPSAFYLNLRLERAHARILGTTESLERIALATGFSSQSHFSRAYKTWCGTSPLAVRNGLNGDVSV